MKQAKTKTTQAIETTTKLVPFPPSASVNGRGGGGGGAMKQNSGRNNQNTTIKSTKAETKTMYAKETTTNLYLFLHPQRQMNEVEEEVWAE